MRKNHRLVAYETNHQGHLIRWPIEKLPDGSHHPIDTMTPKSVEEGAKILKMIGGKAKPVYQQV